LQAVEDYGDQSGGPHRGMAGRAGKRHRHISGPRRSWGTNCTLWPTGGVPVAPGSVAGGESTTQASIRRWAMVRVAETWRFAHAHRPIPFFFGSACRLTVGSLDCGLRAVAGGAITAARSGVGSIDSSHRDAARGPLAVASVAICLISAPAVPPRPVHRMIGVVVRRHLRGPGG